MSNKTSSSSSVNFGGIGMTLLTIFLAYMKIEGKIDWSWWWVFAPLWGGTVLAFVFVIVVGIVVSLIKN